jgi:hypothetical protein
MDVKLEIDPEGKLRDNRDKQPRPNLAVHGTGKLSTAMRMAEDDAGECQCECETLL